MPSIQDLDRRFPIVNPDGTPSDYFLRLINDRGTTQTKDQQTVETLAGEVTLLEGQLAGKADKTTQINAGFGLAGGGDLSTGRTLSLAAILDDLSDVTITSPATDDVIKFDGTGWVNGAGGGGGGGGGGGPWQLVSTTTISASTANVAFTNLGSYTDLLIICRSVTSSGNGFRLVRVSTNNGSSYFSASGDYQIVASSGVETANTAALATSASSTAARTFGGLIRSSNVAGTVKSCINLSAADNRLFVASTDAINALEVSDTAGNLTGGTIYLLGRPSTGGGGGGGQTLLPYPAVDPLANSGALATNQILVSPAPCHSATPITGIVFPFRAVPAGLQIAPCIYDGGPISTTPIQPNSTSLVASGPAITPTALAFNAAPFSSVFTPTVDRIYFVGFAVTGGGNFNLMAPIGNRRAWWNSGSHVPPPATFPASTTNGSGNWVAWWTY